MRQCAASLALPHGSTSSRPSRARRWWTPIFGRSTCMGRPARSERDNGRARQSEGARRAISAGDRFLVFLALVLLGYALDGRGFANLGIKPLFIGEIALVAGLIVLACATRWAELWETPQALALGAFVALGIARTVPY